MLSRNKFSKYLLYAIGEIILVVIGILIALQINNWNEIQKQNKEEVRILKNLKTDIINDTIQLKENIENTIKRDSALAAIINLLAPEKGYDKRKFIQLSLYNIAFDHVFDVNSGTYDESIASGNVKFISSDSLRQGIFDYYRAAKLNLNDKGGIDQGNRALPILFEKLMTSKDIMLLFGQKSRLPELDLNALGKDVEFMSLITQKLSTNNQKRNSWKRFLNDANELLHLIEKELEND